MTGRSAVALQQGLDEYSIGAIAHFEESHLTDRHKAVLLLARAYLSDPRGFGDRERVTVREHLTDQEIVDLASYLAVVEVNKTTVTLGLDAGPVHAVFRADDDYYS